TKRLFHNQSLMLDADQLFHNLIDGVLSAASRY
ncbi:penicillin-binding protein, partial [Enterococcus faecium]